MRLNLNEIMRIEKSAFEYSEFGALESVEIGDKLLEHFLENPDDAIKAYTDLVCRRNVVETDCT